MNLTTPSHRIWVMRAIGTEDTLLDLTSAGDPDQRPSDVLDLLKDSVVLSPEVQREHKTSDMKANGIEIYMAASTAHSKTLNWYLTAWRNENGPAKRVAEGTGVTGTQAVVKYPHNNETATNMYWVDQMTITYENWLKDVEVTDLSGDSNSVGSLWLDACGYRYWLLEFITTGTSAPATNVCAYYGRF